MAPSDLSPSAPAYVPQASVVHAPVLECYLQAPPVELLPPSGVPCPFPGPPPPPPLFASPFQPLLPSPVFARPFQGPPPPPVFACPFQAPPPDPLVFSGPPFMGLPPPVLGMAPPPPMALPAAPMPAPASPLPRLAAEPKAGVDKPPSGSAGTWRVASGRRRPKPLLPPRQRAPACGRAAAADGCHGGAKEETANQPSPRSVLTEAGTSPPDSPPVALPSKFPFPPQGPPPPPAAVTRRDGAKQQPHNRRDAATGSKQPVAPRSPQQAAPGKSGARGRNRAPRRLFNPACTLTTLMVRNIPNGFSRRKLMNILDQHCAVENEQIASGGGNGVSSGYDFLYVPFDFKTNANKGYAFVNVTSPEAAHRLWSYLHGYKWKTKQSHKTCEVDYAIVQGREALVSHFSGSCFECHTEEFLPVWFAPPRDGARPAIQPQQAHVVGRLKPRL
ncbi:hypothetical protein EJB05_43655, partial [Eragrostis curvula]